MIGATLDRFHSVAQPLTKAQAIAPLRVTTSRLLFILKTLFHSIV